MSDIWERFENGPDLSQAIKSDPAAASRADIISRDTGVPPDVVGRNIEDAQQLMYKKRAESQPIPPTLTEFMGEIKNAQQAHQDLEPLSATESVLRGGKDLLVSSPIEGALQGTGMAFEGAGRTWQIANRFAERGLDKILPETAMELLRTPSPWWLDPGALMRLEGQGLKRAAAAVGVPEDRKNLATDITSGAGQMAAQIGFMLLNPALGGTALFSQGVDQQGERLDAIDHEPNVTTDMAMLAGGSVTALSEKIGLDLILNRVPPNIKNKILRQVTDIALAGGIEAAEEVIEGIAHNLIAQATYDPDAQLFEGLEREALAAGGTGALVRGIINAMVAGKARASGENNQAKIDALTGAVNTSELKKNNPEAFRELMQKMGEQTGTDTVFLDVNEAEVLFQNTESPIAKKIMEDFPAAQEEGRDVRIPLEAYLTDVMGSDVQTVIEPHIRLDADAMTAFELSNDDIEAKIQEIMGAPEPVQDVVYNDVLGQLVGFGWDRSTAESYATLHEKFFATMASRTGRTPEELYKQYGLRVNREIDPRIADQLKAIDDFDIILDRLRAGDKPKTKDMLGQSALQFIVERGGLQDTDGELANLDVDEGRVGKNRVVREDGLSLDDMSELLVEAGFIQERDIAATLDVIRQELAGDPQYSLGEANQDLQDVNFSLEQAQRLLDESGLDFSQLSNEDIKAALESTQSDESFSQRSDPAKLSALHNLSSENLVFADKMGGFAVPSLGVVRGDMGIEGMGEITLIGTKDLVDPKKVDVFDADAYTSTFPKAEYKKGKTAGVQALVDEARPFSEKFEDRRLVGGIWDNLINTQGGANPDEAINQIIRSTAGKAWFLKETTGKSPNPVIRNRPLQNSYADHPAIQAFFKSLPADHWHKGVSAPEVAQARKDIIPAIKEAIREKYADRDDSGKLADSLFEGMADENEELYFSVMERLRSDQENIGRKQVDGGATSERVDKRFNPKKEAEFYNWAVDKVMSLMDAPMLTVKRKKVPYTLENIVEYMTSSGTQGQEQTMTFGPGMARAVAATKFDSFDWMRNAAKHDMAQKSDLEESRKQADGLLEEYRMSVLDYYQNKNYRGEVDTWNAMDDSMRALSQWAKNRLRSGSKSALKSALRKNDFSGVPDSVIDMGLKAGEAMLNAPVPYFEAKPQRVVELEEFAGAVVPNNVGKDVLEVLKRNNIKVKKYGTRYDEEARTKATVALRDSLSNSTDVLFQDKTKPKGYFDPSKNEITLTDKADLSTFLHESGHFFLEVMRDNATLDPSIQADIDNLEGWFAANNAVDDRQKHEMFASGFETYLAEGKAPTRELQNMFSRFKSWLVMVYRSLDKIFARNGLDIQLSDEVRGVMDRLVASEDAIEAAKNEHQYGPLPVQQMGMSPEEAVAYQKLVEAADEEANTALTVEVMREINRERQANFKKALAETSKEINEELDNTPAYQARDFLSGDRIPEDAEPLKLNRAYIADIYGKTPARRLNRMSVKDGIHPDLVAPMFGYTSGDEMVKAILGSMNKADRAKYVEAQAKEQLHLEHGDVMLDGTLTEKAQEIVHNEKQADRLLSEMRWLNRAAGKQETPRQYFRAAAERTVAATPVYQLRPDQHRRNEIKARGAAIKAAVEGDFAKASVEQHKALRQFYLYKESAKAKTEADKIGAYGRSLKGKKLARIRSAGDTYYEQMISILEKFEFQKTSNKQIFRRGSMQDWITKTLSEAGEGNPFRKHEVMSEDEKVLANQEEMEDAQAARPDLGITDQMLADAGTVNYRQLTLDGLRAVQDSLKSIEHLARLKNKLLTATDKRTLEQWTDALVESIESNSTATLKGEFGSTRPKWDETKMSLAAFKDISRTPISLLRMLDGFDQDGVAWNLIGRPLQDSAAQETEQMNLANIALKEIFSRYSPRELGRMNRFEHDARLNKSITKHDAISVLLNWGNEGNRRRVLDGFNMSESDAQYIMDKYLTEKDYAFVKDVWAYLETFKEASFSLHRDLFGFTPDEVEPVAFDTKYGVMPGGYYPIKYDTAKSAIAERQEISKQGESFTQSLAAKKKLGSNQARQAKVTRQIDSDLTNVIFSHVSDVIHQTTHDRALYDSGRVLAQDGVKKAITDHHGKHVYQQLSMMLRTIKDGTEPVVDIQDKIAMVVRNNATLAMLGASVRTVMLQPFGITNSFAKARMSGVGGLGLVSGYANYMKNPADNSKQIRSESLYMKNRELTQTVAISRIKNKVANKGKFDVIKELSMVPLMKMQFYSVDAPLYMASRDYFISQGLSRDKSIKLADQVVRDAQGGGNVIDTAQAMQGGPYRKLFTNFLTYMVTTYNLQAENYRRTFNMKEQGVIDFTINTLVLLTMPAILTALLNDWIAGDDDDEGFGERVAKEQASFLLSMNPLTAQGSGIPTGFDYSGPQGTAIISKVGSLVTQTQQGEVDVPLIRNGIWVVGLATGLPAAQINRTVFGIKDALEEDKGAGKLIKQAAFGPER